MKKAIVLAQSATRSDHGLRESFCEGLQRRGWQTQMSFTADPCDLLVCWGVRRQADIARQKTVGGEVCILERGYLGDRFAWTSVSFGGGLNGRGEFRGPYGDASRFERHFSHLLRAWRTDPSGYALLIGQVPGDMSIRGVDIGRWYHETHDALVVAGWRVLFRPHPLAGRYRQQFAGLSTVEGSLSEALAGAALCVTFNSNTGVEAVLAGVPTLAMDRGSMAWDMAGHAVGQVVTPDRADWARRLAWRQWSLDEIRSGECAERVGL